MKLIYFKKIKNRFHFLVVLIAIFIGNVTTADAQVKKAFTQRTSQYTPTKKIYNVKGDFTMLGNTNLTPQNYSPTTNNNNQNMQYVDIDGDSNTMNSSSSTLVLSTENGAIPDCSKIIYAGLYWTGKSSANQTFSVSKQVPNGTTTINNNLTVGNGNNITNTNYSLGVSRNNPNPSGTNTSPIYTFSGNGNTYVFNYTNVTGASRITLSTNGGALVNIPVTLAVSGTTETATLTTPIQITDGTVLIKINKLIRSTDITLNSTNTRNTSTASVNVSGTIPAFTTLTKTFDKRKISLKGPGQANYTQFTAAATDIYYPSGTDDNIYSAYTEITDYVKTNGIGEYFVADIALLEGDPGGTGYSGGWGMVVIYENAKMKYRDITVFDGYAYVQSTNTTGFILPVSGFNSVQTGNVGMKLGLMASEGDVSFTGDNFQVQKVSDASYLKLNHIGDPASADNFFNSSVVTGGGFRNPDLINNTGIDICMIDVPNPGNSVVTNNQTSINFKTASNGDTYSIFGLVMSVDAYIPVVDAILSPISVNGTPTGNSSITTLPGDILEVKIDIKNQGTEAVNNVKLVIPIPYTAEYITNSLVKHIYYSANPSPNNYYFDPTLGPKGSIVFDYGTLQLPANPNDILADFSFKVKITEDCSILKNSLCNQNTSISGLISGIGAITGTPFTEKPFYVGYTSNGACLGEPILNPLIININSTSYVNTHCADTPNSREFVFCTANPTIPITDISSGFPPGSLFYNEYPVTDSSILYDISNPFPATPGSVSYYAIPPGATSGCYFPFSIKVTNVNTNPVTNTSIEYCQGATALPLTATATNPSYVLYYYNSLNGTAQLSITPSTANVGSTSYYVAEAVSGSCIGPKKEIVVTVNALPVLTLDSKTDVLCYGTSTASINITTTGGVAPYTYTWTKDGNPFAATTEDLVNIEAGVYVLTVKDAKSCSSTQLTTTINQPAAALSLASSSKTDASCFGTATGSVSAGEVTGAVGTVIYSWKNANNVEVGTTATVNGLPIGTYTLTVTDNCSTKTNNVTIGQPTAAITLTATPTQIVCFGGKGSVVLSSNGVAPFTYGGDAT
ncbi:SprB repeat-containing protein, partial [Flavobacterium alvei]|uniref:SprB repeat-containing protein n=1 Tax=Flavobacterium alvei TaxID=2080416 RepID=UPI0026EAECCF